ncbi:MAG: hypothetical protein GW867_11800 [Armatimonadetes bacterium]|nr:hypothetical protein [Armatimonadota bacterium]
MTEKPRWLHLQRGALLASLAVVLAAVAFASAAPSVAFVSQQFAYLDEYDAVADLRAAGFEVGTLNWGAVSAESLKPFNAIAIYSRRLGIHRSYCTSSTPLRAQQCVGCSPHAHG